MTTGLQVKADAAELLRCADNATAAIKIQEGFANAIMSAASATDPDDRLVLTFTGIPEGVERDGARYKSHSPQMIRILRRMKKRHHSASI